MTLNEKSGDQPFAFGHREDLSNLPSIAKEHEVDLHGGFAIDSTGAGTVYYGMPGCGIVSIDPDLQKQHVIRLPEQIESFNFHGTTITELGGEKRLILPANNNESVCVITLDGQIDYILPRPLFNEYSSQEKPYKPTDTVVVGDQLYIADGYGSNHIVSANVATREWNQIFGGKTEDSKEDGKFTTAHGIGFNPIHKKLDITDRPNSRIQVHDIGGIFVASHQLLPGSFLCGIDYIEYQDHWYAAIACLNDPDENRPAPILIIDVETYQLLSIIRPKEELNIELAQHMHNVVFHIYDNQLYLICQAWNPGHYFVLQKI